jgi:hypothetical protein
MAQAQTIGPPQRLGFLETLRVDRWWLEPILFFAGLTLFFGYLAVSAFLDDWAFKVGPYLSPVFEPGPFIPLEDRLEEPFGAWFLSPAFVILWGPAGFRLTCYYFRKAYYRAYFLKPPACAVGDAGTAYGGESLFPLILQNAHRYFMYVALILVWFQWATAIRSFHDPDGGWGIGLGSAILVTDSILLSLYLFSCHALRHFVGGCLSCFSCSKWNQTRKKTWNLVTLLNGRHALWAWASLASVAATDLYIRLVANGHITDPNTWSSF